ncbi:hypothetical protein [Acutalibacter muris]|uniref:hypothetical protein n=1 Tax=Acutalibacter muris TaxID=1796620 RepID=UPI001C3EBE6A|nr:hypothetical protein [Acutalibacter muris]
MIQLTKDLVMSADDYNYIVGKPVQREGRGVIIKNPRYYPTVAHAVRGALSLTMRQLVADEAITTLQEFIAEQERLYHELQEKIAPLLGGRAVQSGSEAQETNSEGNYTSGMGEGAGAP